MANTRYKDSVFRDLFGSEERKEYALSLYNALNGTSYDDPGILEVTTLDDALYLNAKNDVSFLVGEEMVLWEHQSTHNPNMPLRGLMYFGRLYSRYVKQRKLNVYGTRLLRLPTPRFVVFYIGLAKRPTVETMRLSDAFMAPGDVEVRATVINVNEGSGARVLEACPHLAGYSRLVERIRTYNESMDFAQAVDAAIQSCIEEGVLADYLTTRGAEVFDMLTTIEGFTEEEIWEMFKQDGLREGRDEGRREGRREGRLLERQNMLSSVADLVKRDALPLHEAIASFGFTEEEIRTAM